MKVVFIVITLLVIALVGYVAYYYVYPEIIFKSLFEEIAGQNIGSNCWRDSFIKSSFDSLNKGPNGNQEIYTTKKFNNNEKVLFLRELINQQYYNFTIFNTGITAVCHYNNTRYDDYCYFIARNILKSEGLSSDNGTVYENRYEQIINQSVEKFGLENITKPVWYGGALVAKTAQTNLIESIYNLIEDDVKEENLKTCVLLKPSEEELSKILLISTTMAHSAGLSFTFTYNVRNVTRDCEPNDVICIFSFFDKVQKIAEEYKSSLAEYSENKLPKCSNTQVYLNIKDLEKKTRKQLENTKEPFSTIWKSILINSYDICSRQLYDSMKDKSCPLIPQNKAESVENIFVSMAIYSNCSTAYIRGQMNLLSNKLTTEIVV